ncbi:uncharacterized protein LOC128736393 [Sabethes cyaneus]|uniref:uncharacterized protein LOC128736393 n=1 Tax=Sabethes cyaneus TaxID=53552 RepID=UPI00237E1201|nr:uncharacterized protein LOC128736393 [Sabethes cyaneus]
MQRWLMFSCILGCLGAAFSLYTAISVGSNGLVTMSTALQQISPAVTAFSNALNTGRNQAFVILNDLMGYVNITYTALNKTWAQNQTDLASFMESVQYTNQTVMYGDQSITSQIYWNLQSLSSSLQQGIDNIMQYYNTLVSQMQQERGFKL